MTLRWEKRVLRELETERKLLVADKGSNLDGVRLSLVSTTDISVDENYAGKPSIFAKLYGYMVGPPETPYENGVFQVLIDIPENYPLVPPKMKFLTIPYHPNVSSQTGAICVDILKTEWSPMLTLRKVLLSLQLLLQCPNPDDPQDHMVATQYLNSTHNWEATAKMWTEKNALNVNYFATLPMLPETDVYMQYQKEALENFKRLLNKSKGSDLPESVTSNFSEHGNDRVDCALCTVQ